LALGFPQVARWHWLPDTPIEALLPALQSGLALSSLLAFCVVKRSARASANATGFRGRWLLLFPVPWGPCWVIAIGPVGWGRERALGRLPKPRHADGGHWQPVWLGRQCQGTASPPAVLFELKPRHPASSRADWPPGTECPVDGALVSLADPGLCWALILRREQRRRWLSAPGHQRGTGVRIIPWFCLAAADTQLKRWPGD